jgi:signal transduction histidine kinase
LNNLSKSLDGDLIEKHGLIAAIKNEISSINKIGTICVEIEIHGQDRYLDHTVELSIFRVIQEAIKNSITHSKATRAKLKIDYQSDKLMISFTDNGIGFNIDKPEKGKFSSGLKNMNNRSRLINAKIDIISSQGNGTTINLEVPTSKDYAKK